MSKAMRYIFFFNDTATTEIYTLSLHDALPPVLGPEAEQDDPPGAELGLHQGRPTGYPLRMQHPPGQQHLVRIRRIPCDDARGTRIEHLERGTAFVPRHRPGRHAARDGG